MFSTPQSNIYSEDVVRSVEFYRGLGFEETFRTLREGTPIHVELTLDGFKVGIAAVSSADHGLDLDLSKPGRGTSSRLQDPRGSDLAMQQIDKWVGRRSQARLGSVDSLSCRGGGFTSPAAHEITLETRLFGTRPDSSDLAVTLL
jgi:hypothetical protein